jgi:hypothetical protein
MSQTRRMAIATTKDPVAKKCAASTLRRVTLWISRWCGKGADILKFLVKGAQEKRDARPVAVRPCIPYQLGRTSALVCDVTGLVGADQTLLQACCVVDQRGVDFTRAQRADGCGGPRRHLAWQGGNASNPCAANNSINWGDVVNHR